MLFPIFVVITLLEIYVLVSVGQAIGGFWTISLVVITALIGSKLLQQQGFAILTQVQQKVISGQAPTFELLQGVVILVSGILLLTPGFITDSVGLLGLMPWSRKYFIAQMSKNPTVIFTQKIRTTHVENDKNKTNKTIEGEFWED